jgi:glycosyltransferase involved in cell wall biosynthesis
VTAGPPLRILHVTSCCTVGGCEQHVLTMLRHLPEERYDRWLAYFEEKPDSADVMVDDFRAAGVKTVDLGGQHRNDPRAVWALGSLMRRESFDLIHTHSLRAELATAFWAGQAPKPPRLVRSIHNTDPLYDHPLLSRLGRWSAEKQDRIIAISDAVADFAHAHLGPHAAPVQRIYYGIDPVGTTPTRSANPSNHHIGIVARLAQQKGYHVLIDAMKIVVEQIPDARLTVVGHEDDLTQAELAGYALQRGVRGSIEFLGFRADIATVLSDVDIFVLPSLWEGFGLVLLEAMALGLPVVATRVGPIPEVVEDERTGLLVSAGSASQLAAALVSLLNDPARAHAMGQRGLERARTYFGLDRMMAQTEQLYAELMQLTSSPQAKQVA